MNSASNTALPVKAKYLYAIAPLSEDRTFDVPGIDGCAVYCVSKNGVAAVVSDCARQKIRPERAHLAAHKEVLKRLMQDATVLPIAFGMIADDVREVRRMLSRNQSLFQQQLDRVAGSVEMGLRVMWDVPNIFEFFVDRHDELRQARDRLMGNQREVRQEDKLELGQLFDRLLNEDRAAHYQTLAEALEPCCTDIKSSPARSLNEVANLNCLVARDDQKRMEAAVFKAAGQFDNNYAFDLNGPWAPHNFVEMELKLNGRT